MIGAKQEWHDDDISMRSSESRHENQDTILSIRTAAAEWEMHVKLGPLVMDHTPIGSNTFHQQHKIFMPMMDVVNAVSPLTNGVLMTFRESSSFARMRHAFMTC